MCIVCLIYCYKYKSNIHQLFTRNRSVLFNLFGLLYIAFYLILVVDILLFYRISIFNIQQRLENNYA